jgi:hypothetical protein
MTPKYWAGIVAGMLAVFVAGMLVARGVDRAKGFVSANLPSPIRLMTSTGFKVDGDKVGDIQRLQLMRATPGQFDSAVVTVKIDDASDVQRIEACTLRATNAHPFASGTRFVCTSHTDSARLDLVPFGHIEVMPGGARVRFYVARSAADEMRSHAYTGAGSSDSGDVDISAGDNHFSITVNGREVVHASGSDGGGSLTVWGANGKPIVQVHGDSNGGSVQVTDANGKKVVDIHGTNH